MQFIYRNTFILLLFFICSSANAQLKKVMHQTFEIGHMNTISLNLTGDFSVEKWAGNTIMTETKVELYEASPAILNHFVEKANRYQIIADTLSSKLVLSSSDKKRIPIRTKFTECTEIVNLKVFVPEDFEMTGDSTNTLIRKLAD